ncbi:hypothetical protein [Streptomyces violaceusniger]
MSRGWSAYYRSVVASEVFTALGVGPVWQCPGPYRRRP